MSKTTIDYMDIELTVEYDFEPGKTATYDKPGCADEAIVNAVYVGGVDIKNIINPRYLTDISERIADSHEEDAQVNLNAGRALCVNQQEALKRIDHAVSNTRIVIIQPSAKCAPKALPSCCEYHSSMLPQGCREGRDCPVRQHIKDNLFEKLKVALVMIVILAGFSLVGEMDYQDAVAQESTKTLVAKKESK